MSAAEQAATYCSALLGGPDGDDRLAGLYATVWTAGHKRTLWRPADNPGAVASLIAEQDADPSTGAVYMCTTLHDNERSCDNLHHGQHLHEGHCKYRPHNTDCAGLLSAWLEVDIAGEGHSDSPYPPDYESAMRVIAEMRVPPTLIVHSGGGLHVYWVFTEPWLVRDADDQDAERERMREFMRNWTYAAKYHAHRLGRWKVDSTFDLARLLRPAGSHNRKLLGNPRPVKIIHHDPDATYEPDDLIAVLPDETIINAYAAPTGISSVSVTEEQREVLKEVNLGAVYARVNSQAYKDADYTPEWLAEILQLSGEVDPDGLLIKTWLGKREDGPKPFKNDQSTYDASLMRLLAAFPQVDTEGLVEALMCRRLRAGATTDKINPRKRIDYIARTVARFRLEATRAAKVKQDSEDRIAAAASLTLIIPEGRPADVADPGDDPEKAEQAFLDYTEGLVEHTPDSEGMRRKKADMLVVAKHTGHSVDRPGAENDDDPFAVQRHTLEEQCLDTLTELLIPDVYRQRGVEVWRLEYRDHGANQMGRFQLKLPVDFAWPVNPPVRYRPGQPLSTDWWRRDVFDGPKGFAKALQRDCLIASRPNSPANEWNDCLRSLIPLWHRDSTGADLAAHAREWLFDYLMLFHGSGQVNEVLAHGRPWVRAHNGWRVENPPVIYIDMNEFLDHCRRQPGAVIGRGAKDVIEYLDLVKRRPRTAEGQDIPQKRRTWYEINAAQFLPDEWDSIIVVTRRSYELSEHKGLRAVQGGKR